MARATFVKKAQKDIYLVGKIVKYESKKGKRAGQTLSKRDRTIPADEGDRILIAKGESYYWWQFMNGPLNVSKTAPKPSQLTQSNYLSQLYSIQEDIAEWNPVDQDEVEAGVGDFKERLESLRDECQESKDNMPDSLQDSPTGELLQERIDACEEAISEFENIDTDYDGPGSEREVDDDWEEEEKDALQEWINEKVEEVQNIEING